MTLCELLQKTKYNQKFYCYVTNNYDQNLSIGAGVRQELLDEEINEDLFWHLLDEVEMITVAADGALVVRTVDKYFNTPLQEQFDKKNMRQSGILWINQAGRLSLAVKWKIGGRKSWNLKLKSRMKN